MSFFSYKNMINYLVIDNSKIRNKYRWKSILAYLKEN